MIQVLAGFPEHVCAFLCSGKVTKHDYDVVLIPAVSKALEGHTRIRLYYETAPDFAMHAAAMWEDFKFGMEHIPSWERVAVVSDVEWVRLAVRAFGFLLPRAVRVFARAEAGMAREWISG